MKKLSFIILILMILFLSDNSYSLDFFMLNNTKYEIDETDIGKKIGCPPGFMTSTVIRDSESQKEIWSEMTTEQAKEIWIQQGKCWPSYSSTDFKHLWNRGKFVNIITIGQDCGASCADPTVTIYRFDGNKVTKIEQLSEQALKLDIDGDQFVAVYKIYEGQCRACSKRWKRDIYKWDGSSFKKIKSEETKKPSDESPW